MLQFKFNLIRQSHRYYTITVQNLRLLIKGYVKEMNASWNNFLISICLLINSRQILKNLSIKTIKKNKKNIYVEEWITRILKVFFGYAIHSIYLTSFKKFSWKFFSKTFMTTNFLSMYKFQIEDKLNRI